MAKKKRKNFAVQLTSGAGDIGRVKSALMFATLAQCFGCDAVIFCVQDGADLVVKDKIQEGRLPEGIPTFAERLSEAQAVGVKFQLCQQVAANRGVTPGDLIEGATIADGSYLIDYALNYDGMLYF